MGRARSRVRSRQRVSLFAAVLALALYSPLGLLQLRGLHVQVVLHSWSDGLISHRIIRSGGSGERCVSRLFTVRFYAPFLSPPCGEEPEGDVTGRVLGIAQNPVSCTQDTCIQCPSPCVRLLRSQADHLSLVQLPGRAAQESASERSWIPKNARGTTHVGI